MSTKPRVRVPSTAKVGEVIEIKTLISHVMETGQRKDQAGNTIPRNIINTFTATFNGKEVFKVDLQPGISANPYIAFYMRVPGPGELELTWLDDSGNKVTEKVPINVSCPLPVADSDTAAATARRLFAVCAPEIPDANRGCERPLSALPHTLAAVACHRQSRHVGPEHGLDPSQELPGGHRHGRNRRRLTQAAEKPR